MTSEHASLALRDFVRSGLFIDGDWVESKDQDPNGAVRLTQLADVGETTWRDRSDRWMNEEQARRIGITKLRPGDVLVARMPDPLGRACLVPETIGQAATVVDVAILRPSPRSVDNRFLMYAINSRPVRGQIELLQAGATRQRISRRNLGGVQVPFVPLDEQRAIADYLDQETAQIDALVAKQGEFIGLLRERRQTVIRAATGWGRPLPEGWMSSRLSHLFRSTGSGTTPANEDILGAGDGDVAWVTTGELRERRIETTQKTISHSTLQKYSALKVYDAGTLLVAMYGATIGRTGIIMTPAATNQACCALVGPVGAIAEFVEYSLIGGREWLLLDASGGGQPNINQDKVRGFRIPTPLIDEQRAIVDHIEGQTSRIDTLIAKAEEHIALAKERRSALITAAVTGQFDVRTARKAG